ncbi:MAG: RagB/SusD family nutrient uptake outer membrane protein [Porphyromonadaceae bacterium]|nr:RagB/SusD family nutrient uptake outer membrane protein [Porphyromonadaceae bacterium]
MKQKFIIISILVSVLSFSACTDWLNTKPESEIILEEFWRSESDVQSVLASCYKGLTEAEVVYRMVVWGELRSDNMIAGSGFPNWLYDMQRVLEGNITTVNSYASWGPFYTVINYCNTLLHYAPYVIDRDNNFTEFDLKRVQSEALTIRALAYFYLLRTFKEVPWIEDASVDDTQNYQLPKDSEETIISNIIRDLLIARENAPLDYGKRDYDKGRVTLGLVNSLLADVYLWNQEYDKAIEACDAVLTNPTYQLALGSNVLSQVFYLGNSNESIFELQYKENVFENSAVQTLYGNSANRQGSLGFPITLAHDAGQNEEPGLYSPFKFRVNSNVTESEEDIRALDSYFEFGGKYYIFKYAGVQRVQSQDGVSTYIHRSNTPNWIIYRLSDIMLMKSEALVQKDGLDNFEQAMELINTTYLRSNEGADSLMAADYGNKIEMEKLVLRERQRELLFEGKRWFDLVRMARRENSTTNLNTYVDRKTASATAATLGALVMDAMYMPIARREIEANPNLKQNPFYEENTSSTR